VFSAQLDETEPDFPVVHVPLQTVLDYRGFRLCGARPRTRSPLTACRPL
jgi:hypothetical protein